MKYEHKCNVLSTEFINKRIEMGIGGCYRKRKLKQDNIILDNKKEIYINNEDMNELNVVNKIVIMDKPKIGYYKYFYITIFILIIFIIFIMYRFVYKK